ncbi:DUF1178 family protein [Sphingomonas lenta]|uniref:DUF1178 domain-containing protein n=1 Tax=Sphingomonas lenta TaxID=1141887 RepID=A0A2A2SBV9_9SPHN|nr:DUF1178 family protein [Sphingomonas lenta]PAX06685.1 hypothetical protein CKY28_16265 [Sphingomonas lenta]
MIVFDLRCANEHVFEAWFGSSAAYDRQREAGQVRCPLCDSADVGKAVMAPNVAAKGNRGGGVDQAGAKRMLAELAAAQAKALEGSEWVGGSFATRARAMHTGEEAHVSIHGQATLAEAKALADEGVPVAPLPLPVTPPEQLN